MKVGDLVVMPDCGEPDAMGLIVAPPKPHRPSRIGVWWFDESPDLAQPFYVDYEPIVRLEVVSESR